MNCIHCHTPIEDTAQFCFKCGQPQNIIDVKPLTAQIDIPPKNNLPKIETIISPSKPKLKLKMKFMLFASVIFLFLIAFTAFLLFRPSPTNIYDKAPLFILENDTQLKICYPNQKDASPFVSDINLMDQLIATDINHFFYLYENTLFSKYTTKKAKKIDEEVNQILSVSKNGKSALFITQNQTVNFYNGGKSIPLYTINPSYIYEISTYSHSAFTENGKGLVYIDFTKSPFTLSFTTNGKKSITLLENVGNTFHPYLFDDQILINIDINQESHLVVINSKGVLIDLGIVPLFDEKHIDVKNKLFYYVNNENQLFLYRNNETTLITKDVNQATRFSTINSKTKFPNNLIITKMDGSISLYQEKDQMVIPFLASLDNYILNDFSTDHSIFILTKKADLEPVIYIYKKGLWEEKETPLDDVRYAKLSEDGKSFLYIDSNQVVKSYKIGSKKDGKKIGNIDENSILYTNTSLSKVVILDDDKDLNYLSGSSTKEISTDFYGYYLSMNEQLVRYGTNFPIPVINTLDYIGYTKQQEVILGKNGRQPTVVTDSFLTSSPIYYTKNQFYVLTDQYLTKINLNKLTTTTTTIIGDAIYPITDYLAFPLQ